MPPNRKRFRPGAQNPGGGNPNGGAPNGSTPSDRAPNSALPSGGVSNDSATPGPRTSGGSMAPRSRAPNDAITSSGRAPNEAVTSRGRAPNGPTTPGDRAPNDAITPSGRAPNGSVASSALRSSRVAAGSPRGEGGRARSSPTPSAASPRIARTPIDLGARLEVYGWLAVAVVVFLTRLLNLDGAPLQAGEAAQAMLSWNMLRRIGFDLGASPLLADGNTLLFMLLGASDAVARAIPCLAGIFVALSPFFLRRQLGRIGALASAAVLAVSPMLILGSRTLDPVMPSLALALGIVLGWLGYQRTRRAAYLGLIGVLAALLLMAGPFADNLLVVLGTFVLAALWERSSGRFRASPGVVGFAPDAALRPIQPGAPPLELDRPAAKALLLAFGITAVLAWTGFLTNFDGLGGAIADPLGGWATALSGAHLASAWVFPTILIGYEPLAVIGGVVGALIVPRRSSLFSAFLVWWAIVGLALLLATSGQSPLWAALIVVPLGLLAGPAAEQLIGAFTVPEERRRFAAFAPLALSLVATLMIATSYASLPDAAVPGAVPRVIALAPALALIVFVLFFALYYDRRSAIVSASAVAAIALFGFSVHAAILLDPGGAIAPDGVALAAATSPDVRTLAADTSLILDELHIARTIEGKPVTEDVQIAAPYADPLRWYLRNAASVTVVSGVDGSPAVAVLGADAKAPAGAYAGQTFQFAREAGPPALDPASLWRWLIYRQPSTANTTWVKVFVKAQLGR